MIALERQIYMRAKSGEMTLEQLAEYLLRTYPVTDIALSLAETIKYEPVKPIAISREEFEQHFRIKGLRPDGTEETRGRRKDTAI